MRPGFFILSVVLLFRAAPAQDSIVKEALPQMSRLASQFWQIAPNYMAREVLKQKALVMPKRRLRIGSQAIELPKPQFREHQVVCWYALAGFRNAPEALHEFRAIVSIDGKPAASDEGAQEKLRNVLESRDDAPKRALLEEYQKAGLAIAATDFGQLILLFTRANLKKYSFASQTTGLIGADRAMVIEFHQSAGGESLRISEAGKQTREPLSGQVWVRETDFQPLRITLNAVRREKLQDIRDEARVDYAVNAKGVSLPAAVVYRRYVNDDLVVENISEYSDWRSVRTP